MTVTPQRLRIRSMRVVPGMVIGAWAGFVPGLFIGGVLGAIVTFAAGAVLEWMRELAFTTGIQEQLLPFGDRIGELQSVQDGWYIAIPVCAVALGLLGALIGALTGALVSASFGGLLGGVDLVVEDVPAASGDPVKRGQRRRVRRRLAE